MTQPCFDSLRYFCGDSVAVDFMFLKRLFCWKKRTAVPSFDEDMKKFLIVGLGNIGPDYVGTRHNIGFMIADALAGDDAQWRSCRYGECCTVKVKNCELMVLKPNTFMNLSGRAVRYWMNQEKLPLQNLLVLVDDIALPFATIRLRRGGSDAGHNGLKNIAEELGNQNYSRLRFGVGKDFPRGGQIEYVLGQFPPEEREELPAALSCAADAVKAFCLSGMDFAMNHFNLSLEQIHSKILQTEEKRAEKEVKRAERKQKEEIEHSRGVNTPEEIV